MSIKSADKSIMKLQFYTSSVQLCQSEKRTPHYLTVTSSGSFNFRLEDVSMFNRKPVLQIGDVEFQSSDGLTNRCYQVELWDVQDPV